MLPHLTRRNFLQAGAGAAAAGLLPARHFTLAQTLTTAPGDPVRFASIGVGIEGSILLRASMGLPQAKCVAACDLYDGRHTLAKEIAGQDIRVTRRYQEILDDKTIEAVLVASPDHWHKQITVDALAAGKDVYCEKPMSHSIAEGEAMVHAVQSSRNFVQVGSQRVSADLFIKAKSLFDDGAIGKLQQVELQLGRNSPGGAWKYPVPQDLSPATLDWDTWLGPAPRRPFDPVLFTNWRAYREYGTGMAGDLMVHLLTGMQFVSGVNAVPDQAFTLAHIERWKDGRNMPDVMNTLFQYGDLNVSVRLTQGTETPEVTRFLGSHGVLEVSAGSVSLTPQFGIDRNPDYGLNGFPSALHAEYEKQWHAEHDPELASHPIEDTTVWHGSSWDEQRPHLANFFNSVRTRQPVVEDVVFGFHTAAACLMANASYFEGKVIRKSA